MGVGISVRQFSPKYRSTDERKHRLADIGGYRYEDRHLGDAEGGCNQNHSPSPSRRCPSPRWLQHRNALSVAFSPKRLPSMASGPQSSTLTSRVVLGIGSPRA